MIPTLRASDFLPFVPFGVTFRPGRETVYVATPYGGRLQGWLGTEGRYCATVGRVAERLRAVREGRDSGTLSGIREALETALQGHGCRDTAALPWSAWR
ncbi:MAG: hypothetical protein AB7L09_01820 [Nitrospira sp.]